MAVGVMWASRATTVALGFVLPALGGFYLDQYWGSKPIATLVGSALGFAAGMMQILRIAREGTGS